MKQVEAVIVDIDCSTQGSRFRTELVHNDQYAQAHLQPYGRCYSSRTTADDDYLMQLIS